MQITLTNYELRDILNKHFQIEQQPEINYVLHYTEPDKVWEKRVGYDAWKHNAENFGKLEDKITGVYVL